MRPAEDPESEEAKIIRSVLRLARRLRRPGAGERLTAGGLALLASLDRIGPTSAGSLAASEGLKPQSVSRLLISLEEEKLIRRPADHADRRRHLITMTPAGISALQRAMAHRDNWLRDAVSFHLSDADYRTLVAASDIMLRLSCEPENDDMRL